MPRSQKSLQLADAYRRRLVALGVSAERTAERTWPAIAELDASEWPERMARELARAQTQSVRLAAGFLAAYIRSETGRGTVPALDSRQYVGVSRSGRPMIDALRSPIIGVLAALRRGRSAEEALRLGLVRARRTVGFEAVQTSRDALLDAIEADERVDGWQRLVSGTCAACEALSGTGGPRFEVHPGCECIPAPSVVGVVERVLIPTGAALFAAKSIAEQDASVGVEAADAIREGRAKLEDFVSHSKVETGPDFLTQAPVKDAV